MSCACSDRPSVGPCWPLALLALLGACSGLSMEAPEGFLVLEGREDEIKATSPEEARLWVRSFTDRDQGGLEFWAAALRRDLLANRGYRAGGEVEPVRADGMEGRLMEMGTVLEGEQYGYLVALFVVEGGDENTIFVVEFTAPREEYDRRLPGVREAIGTLRF